MIHKTLKQLLTEAFIAGHKTAVAGCEGSEPLNGATQSAEDWLSETYGGQEIIITHSIDE